MPYFSTLDIESRLAGVCFDVLSLQTNHLQTAKPNLLLIKPALNSNYIKVDNKEYDALLKLESKRKQLEKERDEFGNQVYEALIALRTEKAVEKELPEAMKYLVFPEVKAVPMPVFTGKKHGTQHATDYL